MRFMQDAKPRRSIWKITRWFVLAALVVVIFLLLKKPEPVAEPMTAAVIKQKAEDFQTKIQELESAHQHGDLSEARFISNEVNPPFHKSPVEQAAPPPPTPHRPPHPPPP